MGRKIGGKMNVQVLQRLVDDRVSDDSPERGEAGVSSQIIGKEFWALQ